MSRIKGYLNRIKYEYAMWRFHRQERRADRIFENWVAKLTARPPEVLLGANFSEFGGVRGHLHGIRKYCLHRTELGPPDWLITSIGLHACQLRMERQFRSFNASAISAIHSHVFPLFTHWCYDQQQRNRAFWIHTYHLNYYPEHSRSELPQWMTDINQSLLEVARHADVRISVSKWQRQELAERYGIETIYIPNGVDVQSCLTASGLRFRNRFQLEKFVLYVGRNDPVKNPEEFVALARQLDDVTCVMIGGDLSKSTMRELCGELPGNLHILGSQPSSVVADAIAAASVVVVTSRREGLPTLVLEAMTQNAQLVVPDEPGCLEAVRGGRFADVYSLGDVNDLTRKVGGLLQRPRQASGARDYVRQHYDWQAVAKQLDAVYTSRKTPSGIGSTP